MIYDVYVIGTLNFIFDIFAIMGKTFDLKKHRKFETTCSISLFIQPKFEIFLSQFFYNFT